MDSVIKRKSIINTFRVAAFTVIFVLLLETVSVVFFPEDVALRYNNKLKDAYSFLKDEPGTIQIAAVGNSDLYSGLIPLELWRQFGYTSTVCASIRQNLTDSTSLLEVLFESQKPKVVIIETDMFYDHKPKKKRKISIGNKMDDFFDKVDPELFEDLIKDTFSVFKFHNYWRGGKTKTNRPYNSHGYKYSKKIYAMEPWDYMVPTRNQDPVKTKTKEQLDKLIELCRSNGAEVILIEFPSINSWNYERYNAVSALAKEKGLQFIDMNMHYKDIGISMADCFRDVRGSHLNYYGAKAATEYIGRHISAKYDLEDLRDSEVSEDWDEDLRKFDRYRAMKRHNYN